MVPNSNLAQSAKAATSVDIPTLHARPCVVEWKANKDWYHVIQMNAQHMHQQTIFTPLLYRDKQFHTGIAGFLHNFWHIVCAV